MQRATLKVGQIVGQWLRARLHYTGFTCHDIFVCGYGASAHSWIDLAYLFGTLTLKIFTARHYLKNLTLSDSNPV